MRGLLAAASTLAGDTFLAAAAVSYCGAFTGPFREALQREWQAAAASLGVACTSSGGGSGEAEAEGGGSGGGGGVESVLARTLGDPVQVRNFYPDPNPHPLPNPNPNHYPHPHPHPNPNPHSYPNPNPHPVQVREWQLAGLPTDAVSTDSALITARAKRWPLLIDPQGQAARWVRRGELRGRLR
jgi:hypothetical protein